MKGERARAARPCFCFFLLVVLAPIFRVRLFVFGFGFRSIIALSFNTHFFVCHLSIVRAFALSVLYFLSRGRHAPLSHFAFHSVVSLSFCFDVSFLFFVFVFGFVFSVCFWFWFWFWFFIFFSFSSYVSFWFLYPLFLHLEEQHASHQCTHTALLNPARLHIHDRSHHHQYTAHSRPPRPPRICPQFSPLVTYLPTVRIQHAQSPPRPISTPLSPFSLARPTAALAILLPSHPQSIYAPNHSPSTLKRQPRYALATTPSALSTTDPTTTPQPPSTTTPRKTGLYSPYERACGPS